MQTAIDTLDTELTFTRFDRMSEIYPERPAVIYLGERFSYRRLRELSERFAGALLDMGLGKEDRVMLYIANSVQWVIAFLGVQKIGAVIVPVAPIYTSHEVIYMIKDAEVDTVICADTNFCYVKQALIETGLKKVIVTNLTDLLPPWKRYLGVLFDRIPTGKVDFDDKVYRFKALLKHAGDFHFLYPLYWRDHRISKRCAGYPHRHDLLCQRRHRGCRRHPSF